MFGSSALPTYVCNQGFVFEECLVCLVPPNNIRYFCGTCFCYSLSLYLTVMNGDRMDDDGMNGEVEGWVATWKSFRIVEVSLQDTPG